MTQRIYLDNAATSWPKPQAVWDAVDRTTREIGAAAGRGAYREAQQVERLIEDARSRAAALIGVGDASRVVFGFNGTDCLNQAILGLVTPGTHVVTSVVEHNSVLRPLRWLEQHRDVRVTRVGCSDEGLISPDEVASACSAGADLAVLNHVSNVTGAVQPIAEVGARLRDLPTLLLVDAAQSLGHMAVDVPTLGADLLAAPTHKGALGPLGGGILYLAPGLERRITPIRMGGTGTQSDRDDQPEACPERYESGNLNVPAIVGLAEGLKYLENETVAAVHHRATTLAEQLRSGLREIPGVSILADGAAQRLGVVSIVVHDYHPQEFAAALDAAFGVQVRAGFHCSPRQHAALGSHDAGGAVRFSLGAFNQARDVDRALEAVTALVSAGPM